jgi:hypothetical protein
MDLNNMQMWQYFALGGGALLVLALVLYFVPVGRLKIPSVVTAGFGGIALGLALGILLMAGFGYKPMQEPTPGGDEPPSGMSKMGGGMAKMGGGMPKMGGGGGGPPGGGGGRPNPKTQLVSLVTALDRVADRPVTITLTPEQRRAIAEQLKGLDAAEDLSEADARAKADAILKIVDKDKDALEAVGYRGMAPAGKGGPGGGGGPGGAMPKELQPQNPFKAAAPAEHLKSLMGRLDAKK